MHNYFKEEQKKQKEPKCSTADSTFLFIFFPDRIINYLRFPRLQNAQLNTLKYSETGM